MHSKEDLKAKFQCLNSERKLIFGSVNLHLLTSIIAILAYKRGTWCGYGDCFASAVEQIHLNSYKYFNTMQQVFRSPGSQNVLQLQSEANQQKVTGKFHDVIGRCLKLVCHHIFCVYSLCKGLNSKHLQAGCKA